MDFGHLHANFAWLEKRNRKFSIEIIKPLSEPVPAQKRNSGDPIMLRRFRPSTLEVSPIHEVFIDDQSNDQATDLARAVAAAIGIPSERIFFVDVSHSSLSDEPYPSGSVEESKCIVRDMAIRKLVFRLN